MHASGCLPMLLQFGLEPNFIPYSLCQWFCDLCAVACILSGLPKCSPLVPLNSCSIRTQSTVLQVLFSRYEFFSAQAAKDVRSHTCVHTRAAACSSTTFCCRTILAFLGHASHISCARTLLHPRYWETVLECTRTNRHSARPSTIGR